MKGGPPGPRFEDIWSFGALRRAFVRARRAKRGRGGEPAFYRDLEENLLALSEELRDRRYVPDPYRYFRLRNRKDRVVSEASFRDRVVHHALVAAIEPAFEPTFVPTSYACRRGLGQHAALARARILARRHPFHLRMDVRRYFDAIDHGVLIALLARRIEDDGVLWLCRRLLAHAGQAGPGGSSRGLPIGNLTSQFWANVYLDPIDQEVTRALGWGTWLRYMDDMAAFGPSKEALWELAAFVTRQARDALGLEMKAEATHVQPVHQGVEWLGWRVFAGTARLDAFARRRLGRRLRASARRAAGGYPYDDAEVARAASAVGHATQGDTMALRRGILDELRPGGRDP